MVDLTQTEFSLLRNHSTRIRTYVPKTFWSRLSLFIIHRWHLSFMRKVLYRYVEHVKIFQNALSWWRYCKKSNLKTLLRYFHNLLRSIYSHINIYNPIYYSMSINWQVIRSELDLENTFLFSHFEHNSIPFHNVFE